MAKKLFLFDEKSVIMMWIMGWYAIPTFCICLFAAGAASIYCTAFAVITFSERNILWIR